jgi:hypothetical protein
MRGHHLAWMPVFSTPPNPPPKDKEVLQDVCAIRPNTGLSLRCYAISSPRPAYAKQPFAQIKKEIAHQTVMAKSPQ